MKTNKFILLLSLFTVLNCNNVSSAVINWSDKFSPYTFNNSVVLGNGDVLNIDITNGDVDLLWDQACGLTLNGTAYLVVNGLGSGHRILFTESGSGYGWNGITFNNGTSTTMSNLDYCTIEFADYSAVTINNSDMVEIRHCDIHYNSGTYGAAINCDGSDILIENCQIHNNISSDQGGGIYFEESDGTIHLNTISNNYASNDGGGICCIASDPVIIHNIISSNQAVNKGGGICCYSSGANMQENNTNSNKALNGAGICLLNGSDNALIENNLIHLNNVTADILNGGGIYCSESDAEITDNFIDSNSASNYGGGIYITDCTPDLHNNKHIYYNNAVNGGGIYFDEATGQMYNETDITHNYASGDGGGIYVYQGAIKINQSTISYNHADHDGGGVYDNNSDTFGAIENSTLNENYADYDQNGTGKGGGICCSGGRQIQYDFISGNNITNCWANKGGGIACINNTYIGIAGHNIISGNHSYFGGGIYCESSPIVIRGLNFISENHSLWSNSYLLSGYGGGIYFTNSDIYITHYNTIRENIADEQGGGIYGELESDAYIVHNSIIKNWSLNLGGGLYLSSTYYNGKFLHIYDNLIVQNHAEMGGGGLLFDGSNNAKVYSNTIANNYCDNNNSVAGGIYSTLYDEDYINDIVWGNFAGSEYNLNANLWQSGSCPNFSESDIEGCTSSSNGKIRSNPLFWNPANEDFHLDGNGGNGSPCIDEGDDAYQLMTTDLDDNPRIVDVYPNTTDDIDMGCYENVGSSGPYWIIYNPGNLAIKEENDKISSIKIYPNPAHDFINIKLNIKENGIIYLKIYNAQGQLVLNKSEYCDINSNVIKLNVNDLSQGIYNIEAIYNGNLQNGKIYVY